MAGFEDDFGEMVEPTSVVGGEVPTTDSWLLEPTVVGVKDEVDPAADFLVREQQQLGELEEEIGGISVSPQSIVIPVTSERSPGHQQQENKIKEEPQVIKEWREKQMERLRIKDEEEEISNNLLKEQAAKELSDWYTQYSEQLERLRATNREARDSSDKTFVAEIEPVEPGTEWERVAKLCDFNPKSARNVKDVSRMRSIILQLKQGGSSTPLPTQS